MAIFQRGNFQLVGDWKKYEKSQIQWAVMPETEKNRVMVTLNLVNGPIANPNMRLSVNLETETEIVGIPLAGWLTNS